MYFCDRTILELDMSVADAE